MGQAHKAFWIPQQKKLKKASLSLVEDLKTLGRAGKEAVREAADQSLIRYQGKMSKFYRLGRKHLFKASQSTIRRIQEHPFRAMMVTTALGFALGMFAKKSKQRKAIHKEKAMENKDAKNMEKEFQKKPRLDHQAKKSSDDFRKEKKVNEDEGTTAVPSQEGNRHGSQDRGERGRTEDFH